MRKSICILLLLVAVAIVAVATATSPVPVLAQDPTPTPTPTPETTNYVELPGGTFEINQKIDFGQIAIVVALLMLISLNFVSLGLEVASWMKR